jgi:hypothetical protein
VLNPDPPEQRVKMVRHVTSHVNVGRASAAALVGKDPVLLRNRDRRDLRLYADSRHGEIALDTVTGSGHNRFQALGALEGGDLVPGQQLDAVRLVNGADKRADLVAKDAPQRGPAREDSRHLNSQLGERSRYFAADESHAHHDRAPARHRFPLDRVALSHRAQVVHARQIGSGDAEPPVASSGGYQSHLVAEFFT